MQNLWGGQENIYGINYADKDSYSLKFHFPIIQVKDRTIEMLKLVGITWVKVPILKRPTPAPKNAAAIIQNRAPGPPAAIAVATPAMLPVPIVADKAMQNTPKLVTSPSALFHKFFWRDPPELQKTCLYIFYKMYEYNGHLYFIETH